MILRSQPLLVTGGGAGRAAYDSFDDPFSAPQQDSSADPFAGVSHNLRPASDLYMIEARRLFAQ